VAEINNVPLKTVGDSYGTVGDIGSAQNAHSIQTNIVRVDGQRSVYLPIMKQGGDTNTIAVVDAVKKVVSHLFHVPKQTLLGRMDRHHRPLPAQTNLHLGEEFDRPVA